MQPHRLARPTFADRLQSSVALLLYAPPSSQTFHQSSHRAHLRRFRPQAQCAPLAKPLWQDHRALAVSPIRLPCGSCPPPARQAQAKPSNRARLGRARAATGPPAPTGTNPCSADPTDDGLTRRERNRSRLQFQWCQTVLSDQLSRLLTARSW